MIEIQEALERLLQAVLPLPNEVIPLQHAVGRVLAQPILSDVDSPPHRKSLMDGFAVRSDDINNQCKRLRVIETISAGSYPRLEIAEGEAARIMTGAPLPQGADAVVMIEKAELQSLGSESYVKILLDRLAPHQHVADRADNFAAGQILFAAGHRVRPTDIGLLAEAGAAQVCVASRPSVTILPTGNELVDCSEVPQPGQIRNSNGPMLLAMVRQLGLPAVLLPACSDDARQLEQAIEIGLQSDLLLLTGGVSEGLLDLVPATLQRLGVHEVFHKVRMKPGKPIWFGVHSRTARTARTAEEATIMQQSPSAKGERSSSGEGFVFGLPGNPVSSLVGFELFVRTTVRLLEGLGTEVNQTSQEFKPHCEQTRSSVTTPNSYPLTGPHPDLFHPALPQPVAAILMADHECRGDRPTFWPGQWMLDSGVTRQVQPLDWRGSSDLLSLGRADGLIYFSGQERVAKAGSAVLFFAQAR